MDEMTRERGQRILILVASVSGLITLLHFLVFELQAPYVVLEELYYIPLLIGTITFGTKGVILTYLIVSAAYMPFFFGGWTTGLIGTLDRVLHLLFSGVFAFLAGFFVERIKRQQKELERGRYLSNLGQVAATIVHDLKNPLVAILGFARRIQGGKGDPNSATQSIIDSAQRMQKIVYTVLDFSKPVQLEIEEEDLRKVVEQASEACKEKAEANGVALSVDVPDRPITLAIDSFNMQRALTNLITNAIEASAKGQDVRIAVVPRKQHVAITIKDDGLGMDDETVENIFFPFYSKKSGGTGLGMAIAKKIIDGHQGRILIKSQTGKGTEVEIELPSKTGAKKGAKT